jgi:hypothetical protein
VYCKHSALVPCSIAVCLSPALGRHNHVCCVLAAEIANVSRGKMWGVSQAQRPCSMFHRGMLQPCTWQAQLCVLCVGSRDRQRVRGKTWGVLQAAPPCSMQPSHHALELHILAPSCGTLLWHPPVAPALVPLCTPVTSATSVSPHTFAVPCLAVEGCSRAGCWQLLRAEAQRAGQRDVPGACWPGC